MCHFVAAPFTIPNANYCMCILCNVLKWNDDKSPWRAKLEKIPCQRLLLFVVLNIIIIIKSPRLWRWHVLPVLVVLQYVKKKTANVWLTFLGSTNHVEPKWTSDDLRFLTAEKPGRGHETPENINKICIKLLSQLLQVYYK